MWPRLLDEIVTHIETKHVVIKVLPQNLFFFQQDVHRYRSVTYLNAETVIYTCNSLNCISPTVSETLIFDAGLIFSQNEEVGNFQGWETVLRRLKDGRQVLKEYSEFLKQR